MASILSAGALAAGADVTFVNPEKFTNIGRYADQKEASHNQTEVAHFIEQLAARRLPTEQALQVEVLDVDLAGLVAARRRAYDVRVMRSVTWPSLKLRYRLVLGKQVLVSGEETVADMDYLQRPNPYSTDDPLRYEKRMLDEWFQKRLVNREPAPR